MRVVELGQQSLRPVQIALVFGRHCRLEIALHGGARRWMRRLRVDRGWKKRKKRRQHQRPREFSEPFSH
jgi:hypothetical protein